MSVIVWGCRGCGTVTALRRKNGRPCPACGGYWSQVQKRESDKEYPDGEHAQAEDGEMVSLADAQEDSEEFPRILIGGKFTAVDTLLGGGIVGDSTTLLSGPPGIGKSTFVIQILQALAKKERVLYVTAEESVRQIGGRSKRLGKFNRKLMVVHETDLDAIFDAVDEYRPSVVVVDSVQMIGCCNEYTGEDLQPGGIAAVTQAAKLINDFAKKESVAFIIIGHVDKDNQIAGPQSGLIHKVDVVLYFDGEQKKIDRELIPKKNRHGSTGPEVRVYMEMREKGLVVVDSPEKREADRLAAEEAEEEVAAPPPPPPPKPRGKPVLKSVPLPPPTVEDAQKTAEDWLKKQAKAQKKKFTRVIDEVLGPLKAAPKRAPWVSADGVTEAAVLSVACQAEDCRGTVDKACSTSTGAREAGFHESRVQLARDLKPLRAAPTKKLKVVAGVSGAKKKKPEKPSNKKVFANQAKPKPKQKPKKKPQPESRT